ncbi:hypothetical protein CAPTEDRAFT_228820 [Capitella teleta]|uniref:DUF7869 domain-containing protein n=1 Tax=Capitella teleta TaxID=283909 RepID=R7USP4_CAPTE|nr:hypothetical protein CAPTEDRAFT_228820 [Capitella teleta]|eukprot:ELU09153.1 hypothetical protein CAPTEDRAFT_228820 [Capitella teleta]
MDMLSLEPREQMLVLLGKISCGINLSDTTSRSRKKGQQERQHQRTNYWMEGRSVCRDTFKFLHAISQDRLTGLLKHYKENGLKPKEKKTGGRLNNKKALTHDTIVKVYKYLENYAETHSLALPGRVPGFRKDNLRLLPSSHTKTHVFNQYKLSLSGSGERIVGETTFVGLWKQLLPFIVTCKPMSDLCWTCQQNMTLIYRGSNIAEEEKSERLRMQEEHLAKQLMERQLYQGMSEKAKGTCQQLGITGLQRSAPCSRQISMHYSFDFAQQVHLPSDPLQPGPIYFLTPRKVGIFGVHCEGVARQVNFLIDEAHCIGKGSNSVISYLHYFFETYGLGETNLHLHCDNCSGQNKNRFVLWYLAWRVATGLHESITLNFLVAGHTKFAPDWCFGLLKQAFRRHAISSLSCLESVVNGSASSNQAQLVGKEDGTAYVPVADWQTHLSPYGSVINGVKKQHHFRFTKTHPGGVFYKEDANANESFAQVFKKPHEIPQHPPRPIKPPGLDAKRQQYLFQTIRPFVQEEFQDVLCPEPTKRVPATSPEATRKRRR